MPGRVTASSDRPPAFVIRPWHHRGQAAGTPVSQNADGLAERIDACLPQTQCGRCGYDGCRPYADAVAAGASPPNRCPPGGKWTAGALAEVLNEDVGPVDPACGEATLWATVRIDDRLCIGCVLCIKACPVDAIVGGAKRGHAVLDSQCTGCERCIAPCPVDCIELVRSPAGGTALSGDSGWEEWMAQRAAQGRARFEARQHRLRFEQTGSEPARKAVPATRAKMARTIEAALMRVADKRAARTSQPGPPDSVRGRRDF